MLVLARRTLTLSGIAVALSVAACGATPDAKEDVGATEGATTAVVLPAATCTWIAGANLALPASATMSVGSPYTGTVAGIGPFEASVAQLGATAYFNMVKDESTATHVYIRRWRAMDVSADATAAITALVGANATTPHVDASYYHCTYDWAHFTVPAGQPAPYVPAYVAVYAPSGLSAYLPPTGCNGCRGGI